MRVKKAMESPTHIGLLIVLNTFTHDSRVLRTCGALSEMGLRPIVFCLHQSHLPQREEKEGISVRRFKLTQHPWRKPLPNILLLIRYTECVIRMVIAALKLKPLVIHANDFEALPIAYLISRLTSSKLIYDSHELWSESVKSKRFSRKTVNFLTIIENWLAKKANGIITVSDSIARHLASRMGVEMPTVIRNIPNSRDIPRKSDLFRNPLRRELNLSSDLPIVLYQGGIEKAYGIDGLIEAFSSVTPPSVLVILGDGPDTDKFKKLSEELGIQSRVYFQQAVPVEVLLNYTADGTIGVVNTRRNCLNSEYCLPNKLFEYLQAGLPVAVNDLREVSALVKRYDVGEVFPDGSSQALAATLNSMLSDNEKLNRYRNAVNVATKELNWDNEKKKLIALYANILNE